MGSGVSVKRSRNAEAVAVPEEPPKVASQSPAPKPVAAVTKPPPKAEDELNSSGCKAKVAQLRNGPREVPEKQVCAAEELPVCDACGAQRRVHRSKGNQRLCAACLLVSGDGLPTLPRRRRNSLPLAGNTIQRGQPLGQQDGNAAQSPLFAALGLMDHQQPSLARRASEPALLREDRGMVGSTQRRERSRPTSAASAPSAVGRVPDMDAPGPLPKRPASASLSRIASTISHIPDYSASLPPGFSMESLRSRKSEIALTELPSAGTCLQKAMPSPSSNAARRVERRAQSKSILERRPRSNWARRRYSACCN